MKYSELAIQIGSRIKAERLKRNMTQLDLASKCDIERANLARIEAGKTNVTLNTLASIAEALEIELKELI